MGTLVTAGVRVHVQSESVSRAAPYSTFPHYTHTHTHTHTAKLSELSGPERDTAAGHMELVLTYYCKTRNIRYTSDCGWPELLVPMLALGMSRADLFNCFYALMTKYIPR